jgi:hypothetical protein
MVVTTINESELPRAACIVDVSQPPLAIRRLGVFKPCARSNFSQEINGLERLSASLLPRSHLSDLVSGPTTRAPAARGMR